MEINITTKKTILCVLVLLSLISVTVFAADHPISSELDNLLGPVIFRRPGNDYVHPIIIRENKRDLGGMPSTATVHYISVNDTHCDVLSDSSWGYETCRIYCSGGEQFSALVTKSHTVKTLDDNGHRTTLLRSAPLSIALVWLYKHLNASHKPKSSGKPNNDKDNKKKL